MGIFKSNYIICPHCGAKNHHLTECCWYCSFQLQANVEQIIVERKTIQNTRTGILLAIFLDIIGALICSFLGDTETKKSAWNAYVISLPIKAIIIWIIFITFIT